MATSRWKRDIAILLLAILLPGLALLALVVFSQPGTPVPDSLAAGSAENPSPEEARILAEIPGIRQPHVWNAHQVRVPDHQEVVGIVVNGKPRAYLIRSLISVDRHVINDVVQDVPVSITYCDRADRARCLTGSRHGEPLDTGIGGRRGNRMMLLINGKRHFQDSTVLPVPDYPFERTTWGRWKQQHPDTDIYVGPDATIVP